VAAKQRWRWHVRIIHQADLNYLNYRRICAAVCLLHEQVPGLLDDPGLNRVLRGTQDPDAPAAVLDHRKDVHLRAVEQISGDLTPRLRIRSPLLCANPLL
jgi:hypothetical protein